MRAASASVFALAAVPAQAVPGALDARGRGESTPSILGHRRQCEPEIRGAEAESRDRDEERELPVPEHENRDERARAADDRDRSAKESKQLDGVRPLIVRLSRLVACGGHAESCDGRPVDADDTTSGACAFRRRKSALYGASIRRAFEARRMRALDSAWVRLSARTTGGMPASSTASSLRASIRSVRFTHIRIATRAFVSNNRAASVTEARTER